MKTMKGGLTMENTASTLTDDALVSAPNARRLYLGGISEATEWRWSKQFASFPKAIRVNNRKFYRVGDCKLFWAAREVA